MKKFLYGILLLLLVGAVFGYINYQKLFAPAVLIDTELNIPSDASFETVKSLLAKADIVKDLAAFETVSSWMKYKKSKVPSGRYKLQKNMSNKQLVGKLRSGDQDPIRVTINNVRKIENLCGRFSNYLELDSISMLEYVTSETVLDKYNLNQQNILSLFVPNTYEFWWDCTKEEWVERMAKEREKFWNSKSRKKKLSDLNMSIEEVYTLASIVEKETQKNDEKARIAGVYLNRLKRGIMLQADPTVVYANQKFDLKRVLNKHLEIDSPYNTYKYNGLPPGPIYMPGIPSLDAVLNAEEHSYLYFCAKPDNSGYHAFAKNLIGHNINAKKYWNWLRKNRIR